jgi:Rieske Fe-S protein
MAQGEEPAGGSRRSFLGLAAALGAALVGLVTAPVAVLFAAPLGRKKHSPWLIVGPATDFVDINGVKETKLVYLAEDGWFTAVQERRIMVREEGPDQWTVFSSKCTHVGCGVIWRPDDQVFFCPCHGGEFNADGSVKKGPPERPLDRLEARKNPQTGMLEVREA